MHRATEAALFSVALVLVRGFVACNSPKPAPPAPPEPVSAAKAPAPPPTGPETIADPVAPQRPMLVDMEPRRQAGNWVTARPGFQTSRTTAQRGGIEPCATPAADASTFDDWAPLSQGKFSAPRGLTLDDDGGFDLVIHLLGDDAVRRELILSQQPFVLVSLTVGPSESYGGLFAGTSLQAAIVGGVERALSKRLGKPAHLRHLAMSAWSAGFVGIEVALCQPAGKAIDSVILIDGLHAPRNDEPAFKAQMKPFVDFARLASRGERSLFVVHSSIDPPNFASTTECAHYLIATLGGKPRPVRRADPFGLELVEFYQQGEFQVRGYA